MTTAIELSQPIAAPMDRCWRQLSDLASHTTWMKDALAIEFAGSQRQGVGVAMACKTRIGPFTTNDQMKVVTWDEGTRIGVEHRGIVSGTGLFTLSNSEEGCLLVWSETLTFPWILGGRIGEAVAKPLMAKIWKGNLVRFARIVEAA
jgi:hypothetical protein